MADKITNDITLLFKTKLDEKSKQEVGKNLKGLLENAAISFDEAETKRNLEPIVHMIKRLFDKAEIAFDADKLLAMPSRQALEEMAKMEVDQLQLAFDKALAKSGGVKIDFGDIGLSELAAPLKQIESELSDISRKIADTTKKSVYEIEQSLESLNKRNKKDKIRIAASPERVEEVLAGLHGSKAITPAKAVNSLETARDLYTTSVKEDNPWVLQYKYLLDFVSKYERLTQDAKNKIEAERPELTQLYDMLSPKAGAVKISLEHYVDVARGNELSEYKNQPWGRETTLKQIRDSLKNGITVKEGSSGDQDHTDDSTPPWEDNDDNKASNKPNTKVPPAGAADVDIAEQLKKAEEERLRLAEQRRIEQEKIAEMLKKEAELAQTPKTKTEEMLLEAVEEAKSKSSISWDKADSADQQRLIQEAIWSKFTPVPSADEDVQFDLEYDVFGYSNGKKGKDLSTVAARFEQWTTSVGQEYDKASDEVKQIVHKLAMIDDELSQEAWDVSEKLYEKNETLAQLIDDDHNGSWTNLKNNLRGDSIPAISADSAEQTNGSLMEQTTLLEKIQKLTTYIDDNYLSSGKHLSDFLDDIQRESSELDTELKEILTTLNLIDDKGNLTFDVKRNGEAGGGTTHNGALISDDFVLIERGDYESVKNSQLPGSTQNAAKDGVNVAEVLDYLPSKHNGGFFDVQGTAKGHNLFENGVISQDVVNATEDQLEQLVQAFIKARDYGFDIENGGSNIVYDKEQGFSFYDLEELSEDDAKFWNSKTEAEKKLIALENVFSLFSGINRDHSNFENDENVGVIADRIKGVVESKGIIDPNAVDDIGRNYEDIYDDVFSGNIDDEYNDVVGMLQAAADAHKQNAAAIKEEEQAQEELNKSFLDGVLASAQAKANMQDAKVDIEPKTIQTPDSTKPIAGAEIKASIDTEELRNLLSAITYNVKVIQDAEPSEDNKVYIDEAALENVLNRITYNVKISYDDADKTANKIAIDESVLESTLKRVFTNVLNPNTEQNDSEPKNEPWALEKTLLNVNEVLGQIQTNTTKTESLEIAPASTDVGNVLATENTLAAIKTAVESINSKVVKGTKTETSSKGSSSKTGISQNNTESHANSQYFSEKLKTQTMQLAKFRAQLMTTGKLTDDVDAQIYELLDGLHQVQSGPDFSNWSQKFQQLKTSVGIADIFDKAEDKGVEASYKQLIEFQKTRNKLELQYEKAEDGSALKQFYAEQLTQMDNVIAKQEEMLENEEYEAKLAKMRAEQEIKLGAEQAKQADREAKAAKKEMQKQAMLGKAGNAVGRAQGVYIEAEGLDKSQLPSDFGDQLDAYYNAFEKLRVTQTNLSKADIISEDDKKDLRDQINNVNQMTSGLGELISQYQRLSGDNVQVLGANTLGPNAGLKEYEAELKRLAATSANGNIQIKSFDNNTKTLTWTVKNAKRETTTYTGTLRGLDNQFVAVAGSTKKAESFFEATKRKMAEISSYMSGMAVFSRIGQELRRGIQYVREIDLALTELRKVTDKTEEEYDQFLQTAANTGARLGTTISAVTEATATFAKLGYEMKQATEMAESAIVYKNVGDNIASTEDAADSIISTMKGFGLEASESMEIVDRFNEVGNRFAITSQGIGEALRLSASALSEGGNSLDESIGLITAANEVVNDPSSVGTALKTLTLRLRGSKTELEEMGEDVSDMATTTSQLQAKLLALTGGQVDIMLDENTFKNSTQILREMAAAWEDMSDIQRASALELMGGKRQANVLSALIKNFDTVESAIEASSNSAGSALEENERYLDSIQGRIDQFNNSVQAMWSNALNSDMVKDIVSLGTEIIKIIDKIGLLNSLLIALATYSMIKNKMGPIAFLSSISDMIKDVASRAGVFIGSLTGMTTATSAYTAETLAASVANGTLSASEAANIASKNGLTLATTNLTAAEAADMLMKSGVAKADALALVSKLGLSTATSRLTAETLRTTMANLGYAPAQIAAAEAALFGAGANTTLAASFGALWKSMLPLLLLIAVIAAVVQVVQIFDALIVTTEELQEELDDMKSSLSDVRSELDSVNQELETTQERMAELLAKDTLTFVEQEELDKLKETNDELERRKDMLEAQEEYEAERVGRQAAKVINSAKQERNWWETGLITGLFSSSADEDVYGDIDDYSEVQKEIEEIEKKLANRNLSSDEREDLNEELRDLEEDLASEKEDVVEYIDILTKALDGVEYGDSEESDAALDYYHQLLGRWNVAQGTPNAKSNEIKRILNKDEFSDVSDEIDKYVKALEKGDKSAKDSIDSLIKNNADLVAELNAMDIDPQDAVDYFTKLGQEANFSTLDGKITEVSNAATIFEGLLNEQTFNVDGVDIGLADLFDEEGKVIQTKLSQVFQNTSDQTREDITNLLEGSYEQIKNGTVDTERLLTGFGLKTAQQVLEIQNKILGEQNLELFPNLEEEIDGIIDKFDEFSAAIGSVVDAMDTLEQARAEEAYSGSISIETLENLMKYTDDYSQLVEIDETGAITLAKDAEKLLIEQRIQKIKTDAAAAVQTAQTNLEQAKYNAKAVNETGPVQEALTSATDALAGSWAYLGSIIGDVGDGNFKGMFERASTAYGKVTAGRKDNRTQVNVSVEDAQEALNKALDQQKIADALTSGNIKSKYSSDEASGGNKTKEDVEKSALEKLMEDFQREMDYWENRIAANQARYEQLQNEIDLLESKGQKADASYYEEQIKLENERLSLLQQQKAEAQKFLGTLTEGSEEWWEVANTLNDIESELDDVTASIVDLQDAIAEIDTYKFEEFNTRLDNLINKLGTIRDLIAPDEEDWFDDEGNWTEEGVATLGTYVQELELYKNALEEVNAEREKYTKSYAGNKAYYESLGIHSEQELYDKQEELTEQQYNYMSSISDTEQSIVDMYESSIDAVEEYIETLIDGYNDYIDSVKEALDAERD